MGNDNYTVRPNEDLEGWDVMTTEQTGEGEEEFVLATFYDQKVAQQYLNIVGTVNV